MTDKLAGAVALVTGAGSGIGAASAEALAAAGAAVAVSDLDFPSAQLVAHRIADAGHRAMAVALDVSSETQWLTALDAVTETLGTITVLHSNAALTTREAYHRDLGVIDLDLDLIDSVLNVNLKGGMLACKHVVPGMLRAGGGSIILTSSVKGSTGSSFRTAYSVSKAGLDNLARVVATGYGKRGVRCNAVAPGIVATEALDSVPPEQLSQLTDAHLTPTLGRPVDIANAVVFLASDDARFITGQVLYVDGGLTAHTPALSPTGSR
jgi:NAD(P)-dependent dehydrogenase (short-subunit alcohol dehydrogenase family)